MRLIKTGFLLAILFLVQITCFASQLKQEKTIPRLQLFLEAGNIYYSKNKENRRQITASGKDLFSVLSPDGKIIAFVRNDGMRIPEKCRDFSNTGNDYANQIWIYDFKTKKERLLVSNDFSCDIPEKKIVDPDGLKFSNDGKIIYFITSGWATSGALHAVNIDGAQLRYIASAHSFDVVSSGKYKNHLLVEQHRYHEGGGSYQGYGVFDSQGKERIHSIKLQGSS